MNAVAPEVLGYLAVAALIALVVVTQMWLATRRSNRRYVAASTAFWASLGAYVDRRAHIDALIESALHEGAETPAETFDARLLPLSDSEVATRIRRQIDENTAVRELRTELDTPQNWSA